MTDFFPLLHDDIRQRVHLPRVPWEMVAPHEAQVLRNHHQTLERLAERGGLSCTELLAVLEDRRFDLRDVPTAIDRVRAKVEAWHASKEGQWMAFDPCI